MDVDTSEPLSKENIKHVQDIVGTLLYYGCAVDPTLLTALSSIAAQQSNGTIAIAEACQQRLDYVTTHPNAGIRCKACDMILTVHTDASYLSEHGGKSRASAHFYLNFYLTNDGNKDFNNGAILNLSSIIKHVMSSASKAVLAVLYYGCKLAVPLCTTLEEMGHPQLKRTMVTTDNITTQGFTMGTMTPKASKINASICSNVAMLNINLPTFGDAAPSIAPTTPAKIIRPSIIKPSAMSMLQTHSYSSEPYPLLQHLQILVVDPRSN
jgi:hypothetical protein